LHPAHVLPPGDVSVAGGLSGQALLLGRATPTAAGTLQAVSAAPGVAPWIGIRAGLPRSNEAGLSATSRTVRLDGRHAFDLGTLTLSLGAGANAIFSGRLEDGQDPRSVTVYGGGADIPVLIGANTANDLYALWVGPRLGLDWVGGRVDGPAASVAGEFSARRIHAGLVLGLRAGFRHLHAALEVSATYHHIDGSIGGLDVTTQQWAIAPAGALVATF
jgi:hypothetical protein